MDLSQFAVDSLVVVAVFVIVNLVVKPLIEIWITQTNVAHDPLIRGLAVFLGVTGVFIDHGLPVSGTGGAAWIGLTLSGILSGLSAIGLFHVASTGSASPTPIAGTLVTSEGVTPSIDYAALAAALEPVLARFAPGLVAPAPERVILPASATLPLAVAPPSPAPEPAAPAAPPA